MKRLERIYTPDPKKRQTLRFFCHGDDYEFWGLFHGNLHLACPAGVGSCSCSAPTGWAAT